MVSSESNMPDPDIEATEFSDEGWSRIFAKLRDHAAMFAKGSKKRKVPLIPVTYALT